jgi:hypothetical protein
MPADRSDAACTVAGVRKPSMKEPAGNGRRWCRERRALWRFAHDGAARHSIGATGSAPRAARSRKAGSFSDPVSDMGLARDRVGGGHCRAAAYGRMIRLPAAITLIRLATEPENTVPVPARIGSGNG